MNDINARLTDLSERFNELTSKYDEVYSELQQCKIFNSHLLTRITQLERNAVTNSQYSRRETIELNPVSAEIHENVSEESICKALSLTGVDVVPENLNACHRMKRSERKIVKFKCRKQERSLIQKCKNLGNKSQELTNLKFSEDFLKVRVCHMKTSSLLINVDGSKVPGRYILPGSSTML